MTRPKQDVRNPWGFTHCYVDLLDIMCKTGNIKAAAARLGIEYGSARTELVRCSRAMGVKGAVLTCLAWDRWRQTEGKGVPA